MTRKHNFNSSKTYSGVLCFLNMIMTGCPYRSSKNFTKIKAKMLSENTVRFGVIAMICSDLSSED